MEIPYITVCLVSTGIAIILVEKYKKRRGIDLPSAFTSFTSVQFLNRTRIIHSLPSLTLLSSPYPCIRYIPSFTALQFNTLYNSEYIFWPIRFTHAVNPCFLLKLSLTKLELYFRALAKSCPTIPQKGLPWMDIGRLSPSRLHSTMNIGR